MVLKSELRAAEKSMAGLKELLSKGGAPGISESLRRADFIASGRMGAAPVETA